MTEISPTQNDTLRKEVSRLNKIINILIWIALLSIALACLAFNFNYKAAKEFNKQHIEFQREQMLVEPTNAGDTKPEVDIDEQNMRNKT